MAGRGAQTFKKRQKEQQRISESDEAADLWVGNPSQATSWPFWGTAGKRNSLFRPELCTKPVVQDR